MKKVKKVLMYILDILVCVVIVYLTMLALVSVLPEGRDILSETGVVLEKGGNS